MDWVCGDSWKGTFTQSIFFVGGVIGALTFGYVADKFGRKLSFYGLIVVMCITYPITPFCKTFASFTAIRFFNGLCNETFFQIFYMLCKLYSSIHVRSLILQDPFLIGLEYTTINKRALVGAFSVAIGMTIGGVIQPLILKPVGNWNIWFLIIFAQPFLLLLTPWFVHESVRWLAGQNRIDEAVEILKKIAKTNNHDFPEEAQLKYRVSD